jgi:hypothetical protein
MLSPAIHISVKLCLPVGDSFPLDRGDDARSRVSRLRGIYYATPIQLALGETVRRKKRASACV